MYKPDLATCPYCEGGGEVFDSRKVTAVSIDPPMVDCPVCGGSGEVYEDDLDDIDTDRSISEYEQDQREAAAEARWEYERENPDWEEEDNW